MVLKIAFLAPEFYHAWGGVGIYSISLLRELQKDKDLEIHVLTPDIEDDSCKSRMDAEFKDLTIHTLSTAKDTFVYNLKFQLAIMKEFPGLHRKIKFDIVHSANLVHMPDVFLKFRNLGIPSIVTAHTTIHGQVSGFLKGNKNPLRMAASEKWSIAAYPMIRMLEKFYIMRSSHFITVSKGFREHLMNENSVKDVEVIYNSIDVSNYDFSSIKKEDCVEKFPVLKHVNEPVILYAGRLITQKGIEVFIESLARLKAENVRYRAVIAGKGDDARLMDLVKSRGLTGSVVFVGYIDNRDLRYFYRFADVFSLPSYYENFPISLLESMSMRCVPVATDVGAVDEIIDDGKNGFIVDAGDAETLTEKLKILLQTPELRKRMAAEGQKKILKKHTSGVMASKTKAYYWRITGLS